MKNKGLQQAAVSVCLAAGFLLSPFTHASSITYFMNDTNVAQFSGGLPDGTNYLTVKIDDDGAAGLINFTVSVIPGALSPTNNFGIQSFGFNITGDAFTPTVSDFNLPFGWALSDVNAGANAGDAKSTNQDGYGMFDVVVADGGQNRLDPLTFSIDVGSDTINSYFDLSVGGGGQPKVAFAAHVTGISTGAYTLFGDSNNAECIPGSTDCQELPSAFFGGSTAVPVPAAVWLFGSGLLGLVGVARRKSKS